MQRWIALQEGAGGTLGWLTTNERKEAMCLQLREALAVGNLSFSASFFSTTQTVAEARAQLKDELCNFCVLVEPSKTPFGKGARIRAQMEEAQNATAFAAPFVCSKEDLLGQDRWSPGRPRDRAAARDHRSAVLFSERKVRQIPRRATVKWRQVQARTRAKRTYAQRECHSRHGATASGTHPCDALCGVA